MSVRRTDIYHRHIPRDREEKRYKKQREMERKRRRRRRRSRRRRRLAWPVLSRGSGGNMGNQLAEERRHRAVRYEAGSIVPTRRPARVAWLLPVSTVSLPIRCPPLSPAPANRGPSFSGIQPQVARSTAHGN